MRTHVFTTVVARVRSWVNAHRIGVVATAALAGLGLLLWLISPAPDVRPPRHIDLPFYPLLDARAALLAQASHSAAILAPLAIVLLIPIWLIAPFRGRTRQAISASIVIICMLLALQAQVLVMRNQAEAGLALYLIAGALFFAALPARSTSRADPRLSHRAETILLILILSVTLFARIYELKRMPYGIDGDESKWTVEVVRVMVDDGDIGGSEYHRRYLPMSFFMQAPFHWIMGAGLTPGRVAVAVFSVIASFVFYRLVRELFDAPIALIATLLLAVSLLDINASRAGNVESHVKLWAILPLYTLAVAFRTRRLRHFLLTGFALAGAMLTYETLMPVVITVIVLTLALAVRERKAWRDWLRRIAALLTAPAAVSIVTIDYLLGRLPYYLNFRTPAEVYAPIEQTSRALEGLIRPFVSRPLFDALYQREGPLINGLLVPLLLLGLICALAHLRRRGNAFTLTWLLVAFVPIPLVLHSPLPRVFYPGTPVLYVFVALALMSIYRSVNSAIQRPRLIAALGIFGLSAFALLNLTIWFHEATDSLDELRRREVGELVAAAVEPGGPLLLPYYPFGEALDLERDLAALYVRERRGSLRAGQYLALPFDDLLPRIAELSQIGSSVRVLFDRTARELLEQRQTIISTFRRCYGEAPEQYTTYFELYRPSADRLRDPICHSAHLTLAAPPPVIDRAAAANLPIAWELDTANASQSNLTCEREQPGLIWLEAESFNELKGWIVDQKFVLDWSGDGYLADTPNSDHAGVTLDVPQAGDYQIWIRTYRRQADDFFGTLEIFDHSYTFADTQPPSLNTWEWKRLGTLTLDAGRLPIRIARPFDLSSNPRYIALFIDTILLTSDPAFDPNQSDRWVAALSVDGPQVSAQAQGSFNINLERGRYRCMITVSDDERLVDASGAIGIRSEPIEFEVRP